MELIPVQNINTTGDLAVCEVPEVVQDVWTKAEALMNVFTDKDTRSQVAKMRNHAMRRLGQMYFRESRKTEFLNRLKLTEVSRAKITSLAGLDQMDFEARESQFGDTLWVGTNYGDKLARDRQRMSKMHETIREAKKAEPRKDAVAEIRERILEDLPPEEKAEVKERWEEMESEVAQIYSQPEHSPILHWVKWINRFDDADHLKKMSTEQRDELFEELEALYDTIVRIQGGLQS